MKKQFNKKIKTAILASILALSFNTTTYAFSQGSLDFSKEFKIVIESYVSVGSSGDYTYLYYTPVDKTERVWDNKNFEYVNVTYKAGVLYYVEQTINNGYDNTETWYDKVTALGDAADIFGEGISGKLRKKNRAACAAPFKRMIMMKRVCVRK